jgi:hypothetical protein
MAIKDDQKDKVMQKISFTLGGKFSLVTYKSLKHEYNIKQNSYKIISLSMLYRIEYSYQLRNYSKVTKYNAIDLRCNNHIGIHLFPMVES